MGFLDVFNYVIYVGLMLIGLYAVIAKENLVKKVLGLSLFQTGIFIFYISMGVVDGGSAPIVWAEGDAWRTRHQEHRLREMLDDLKPAERAQLEAMLDGEEGISGVLRLWEEGLLSSRAQRALRIPVTNPLPHVLILTAIVVSVSTMAVALAILVNIKRSFGTLETDVLSELERAAPP